MRVPLRPMPASAQSLAALLPVVALVLALLPGCGYTVLLGGASLGAGHEAEARRSAAQAVRLDALAHQPPRTLATLHASDGVRYVANASDVIVRPDSVLLPTVRLARARVVYVTATRPYRSSVPLLLGLAGATVGYLLDQALIDDVLGR